MKCKTEKCEKVFKYLKRKEGTLEIIDNVPKAYPGFKNYVRKEIEKEKTLLTNNIFKDDIISAMESGYKNALMGYLRSAEESNRFIIERASLHVFVSATTQTYLVLLKEKDWHKLVDEGYVIRAASEGLGRIKKAAGKTLKLNENSVYLMGAPVCRKHLKFIKYSKSVDELEEELRVRISDRCKFCHRQAEYFTLAMPKASALIGLAGYITNKNVDNLMRIYSNISRIIHPYGFTELDKDKVFTAWARDFLNILFEINNLFGFIDGSRSSSNDRKSTR
ncbi:hypothetical protein DFR86_07845 [Acidianus sulfidivorans JP7]|uniref:Uncharacterized protein n=1 Tax=Acidianus sulfidivorans JP7 TaxID=619593 RepID=A0A2U9IN22_9CREN|nr:hypothetical protein [Acidianus sulfidivorans]AWR97469.1 hypothetical protein DFR86_07845 [Acidianus sulfidivorans JP7]